MATLDKATYDKIVTLIEPLMSDRFGRERHVRYIFMETGELPPRIDYDGAARTVTERIVFKLAKYGKLENTQALWSLLKDSIAKEVGIEQQQQIDAWEMLLNVDNLRLDSSILPPDKERACPTAPKPPAHFSGRREELDRLQQTLAQGTSVAITGIQGMGGIGKTALALQLAHEMTDFSGVLWASLGPQPTAINLLINWARFADPDFDPGQEPIDTVVYRVQALLTNLIQEQCPGQVLIILDDIWEESIGTARLLQKAAPANSALLLTTRSQKVVAQLRSTRLELKPMQPQEALQMMRKLLADYPAIPDEKLIKLAQTVGFHPLAMELAAGQVTLLERPERDIDDFIDNLGGGIPGGSPFRDIKLELGEEREDNLELVLSFSYKSLSETEQAHFRQLGILAYGAAFDKDICKAIWGIEPKPVLDALRHRAMLGIAEEVDWYQQHSLLRAYARALLNENDETDTIFRRYAEHMTGIGQLFMNDKPEEWNILTQYLPHIHDVGDKLVHYYADNSNIWNKVAVEFAYNTTKYLERQPEVLFEDVGNERQPVRLKWLEMGIAASQLLERRKYEGFFIGELGLIHAAFGNLQTALNYFLVSLDIDRELGDKAGEASSLSNIASMYSALGDIHKSLVYLQQVLVLDRKMGNRHGEANTLNKIGRTFNSLGDLQQSLNNYNEALFIRREIGDKRGEANTLNNIGSAYDVLGDYEEALKYFEQALILAKYANDKGGEAAIINNIGKIYHQQGQYQRALAYYEQSLPIRREVGDKPGEATTLNNIGAIYERLGEAEKCLDYYNKVLALDRETGYKHGEATSLHNIGGVYEDQGKSQQALTYFQESLEIRQKIGDKLGEAKSISSIGSVYMSQGDYQQALVYYQQALNGFKDIGAKPQMAMIFNNIGKAHQIGGDNQQALSYYQQAISILQQVGDKYREAITFFNIGRVYESIGDLNKAIHYLERCVELGEQIQHPNLEKDRQYLADLKNKRDKP